MLRKYEPDIRDFGLVTQNLYEAFDRSVKTDVAPDLSASNQARMSDSILLLPFGIAPSSYFDRTLQVAYSDDKKSSLGASETLYTARGVQGMGIEESYVNDLYIDKSDYSSTFLYMDME